MLNLTLLQLKVLWTINKKISCGYEIMKLLKYKTKAVRQGTLYPLLKSLMDGKLVTVKNEGNRSKKFYTITEKGTKELKKNCEMFCSVYNDIFEEFVCDNCRK